MSRKRINISVTESQYDTLTHLKDELGLKNVCELTRALLNIVTASIEANKSRQRTRKTLGEDIEDIFNELAYYEKTHPMQPTGSRKNKD